MRPSSSPQTRGQPSSGRLGKSACIAKEGDVARGYCKLDSVVSAERKRSNEVLQYPPLPGIMCDSIVRRYISVRTLDIQEANRALAGFCETKPRCGLHS